LRELKRLPYEERKKFARNENEVQSHLDDMANKLLHAYKNKLLEFARAKTALKRYE
jgi:phage-related protein